MSFLETLVERHRMPVIFRIRARYEELWDEANKLLPVEVTAPSSWMRKPSLALGSRFAGRPGRT